MKILAPLRSSSEVQALKDAGADEFYCGLTPPGWAERFGGAWINRRNPASAGLPSLDELRLAVRLAGDKPVFVTLNAPYYPKGARNFLAAFGRELLEEHGVSALIVADHDLLLTLAEAGLAGRVHLSSLATCVNSEAAAFYKDLGVSRLILPRHLTLDEIGRIRVPGVEVEVFLMNDGCVFEEGLCATTHAAGSFCLADAQGSEKLSPEGLDRYDLWKWTLNNCGCRLSNGYQVGPCGLCALPRFLAMGIASLKVVGREASLERKAGSVSLASRALEMAREGRCREEIRAFAIQARGAAELCKDALLCYYPDVWAAKGPRARKRETA